MVVLTGFTLGVCGGCEKADVQRVFTLANLSYVNGLCHHHFQCWHHCLLCPTLIITWLMPVSSYIAYILANLPINAY